MPARARGSGRGKRTRAAAYLDDLRARGESPPPGRGGRERKWRRGGRRRLLMGGRGFCSGLGFRWLDRTAAAGWAPDRTVTEASREWKENGVGLSGKRWWAWWSVHQKQLTGLLHCLLESFRHCKQNWASLNWTVRLGFWFVWALLEIPRFKNFFIFNLSRFCKNIWSGTNLAKIYIWRRGPRRQGHNAAGHGARCRQEWALSRNAKGHDVKSLSPLPAALGA
jgi:hypothetical protein